MCVCVCVCMCIAGGDSCKYEIKFDFSVLICLMSMLFLQPRRGKFFPSQTAGLVSEINFPGWTLLPPRLLQLRDPRTSDKW